MMDEVYQYDVFFECPSLQEEKKPGLERYFSVRRRSGGGDCGALTSAQRHVYRISFRDQTDQQRVLQRCKHVVEFADGPLVFTVRDSLEPPSTPITASNLNQELTESRQCQHSGPASIPPPSGEEYELRPDSYLLRYLTECQGALKELQTELATVACSAQLYPEEGRVSVRRLAPPHSADAGRNWKAEVDKLFDDYVCHYEVDPHKVKALLLSGGSSQTSDELMVYDEIGLAVVVGKHSLVNARLTDVEDSSIMSHKSLLREHQSSIYRLGEAKLRLLWREIENGLGKKIPGVKVTKGDRGQVVLEGCAKDILDARGWISGKEDLLIGRTVSLISPQLLSFLQKMYGGPGVLGDLLGVGNEVEIELKDTDLCLFSLSASKLDYAGKVLQDEFKEIKIEVPNCTDFLSELQKKLDSMTDEMRAQVLFGSDNTVCLLGHSKEVDDLGQTVTLFILDRAVQVPYPELVQDLPVILQQHGLDFSGVTFHPFTIFSVPMVVLEGPSSKVAEVRTRLRSLIQDMVNIDPMEQSQANTVAAKYSICDGLQVLVCHGDITKQEADALVNAANEDLDHCGGVAAALRKAGGPEIQRESTDIVKRNGKIPTGDVVVTTGGNLPCKKLLHAVGPVSGKVGGREKVLLEKTVQSALDLAERMKFKSIAMPCISSGVFGVPVTECAEAIVTAVKEFGGQGGRRLRRIILIDNRAEVVRAIQDACDRLLQGMSATNSVSRDLDFQMDVATQDTEGGASAGASEGGVVVMRVQGTIETQQVDALVSPMVGHCPLSSRVGNCLYKIVGSYLTARFGEEAGDETIPGDAVLVEGFTRLPSNAVFFLNLLPWDDDKDGAAIKVLRLGISNILTSCDKRGFESVAFPALGAGISLHFPTGVVASVLQEQINAFKQSRTSRRPLQVLIVLHPSDTEAAEMFKELPSDVQPKDQDTSTPMLSLRRDSPPVSATKRVIMLGKTGSGKSTLGNSIFGEEVFAMSHGFASATSECQAETRSVSGRSITLIDTPGLFSTNKSQEDNKSEILTSITECAPGPHAFLIVLKVSRFTEEEQAVITNIHQCLSEEAMKYAVIVITHGDLLPEGTSIWELVSQCEALSDLVRKCGERCHIFDNKHWTSSQVQVEELLNTIDKMVMKNNGGYYTNGMLQTLQEAVRNEEEQMRESSGNVSQEVIRRRAKIIVSKQLLIQLAGFGTGAIVGAFFGVAIVVGLDITAIRNILKISESSKSKDDKTEDQKSAKTDDQKAAKTEDQKAAGVSSIRNKSYLAGAVTGAAAGGVCGYEASKDAKTPWEAAEMAASAVFEKGGECFSKITGFGMQLGKLADLTEITNTSNKK